MTAPFCAACGTPLRPDDRFCAACGGPVRSPIAVDDEVLGTYHLRGVIAEGGMGIVYRAYDERLERNVALKLLRDDFASDAEFRERFIRESRAAASLDHPNILPVFDAGEVDGTLYIATRLVDGQDLRRLIAREGALSAERALRIVEQIAAALDYAHHRGIVHRDVKPANVLIVSDGAGEPEHAYLIDFGIIKRADGAGGPQVTQAGRFVGTPEYAAPEQIVGDAVSGQADQYALACILFHCLAGHSPYADTSSAAVMQAHISAPPPRIAAELPGVPAALDAAITRALDKNPSRRHHTCRAFVEAARTPDARTALETPRDFELPPDAAARPPRKRRTGLIAMAAIVALALVAVGALEASSRLGKHDPPPTPNRSSAKVTATSTPKPARTATHKTKPSATATATPPAALDVSALDFEPHAMVGYTVSLPEGWRLKKDDEPQPSSGATERRRTAATESSTDAEVAIDHLTHFGTPPATNRSNLEAVYSKSVDGYEFVSDDDYQLGGHHVYEWRYDVRPSTHRVDLLFATGGSQFAILATGSPDSDSLAELAKAVAGSIKTTATASPSVTPEPTPSPEPTPTPDPRIPESGTYSGVGTQHSSGGDDSGVTLTMTFGHHGSTVEYTKLGCTAKLKPTGFDGSLRVYHEHFTSGSCDDPGTWKVDKVSDSQVEAEWSARGDDYTITATLSR